MDKSENRHSSVVEFSVNRPVATMMIFLGIALTGAVSWVLLPRELFPAVVFPELTVLTKYSNAAPEEIENMVTKVVEENVGTVPNLKRIRSSSKEGVSLVTLEFNWGTDMGFAHLSVREKLDQIKDRLPLESDEPIIQRVNPFAHPVLIISVTGDRPLVELTDISKRVIKHRLEKVNGVASAIISGGQEPEILVEVDSEQIEARKIALMQVVNAIKQTNLNYPAGTTQGKFYEYLVRTIGEYENVSQIGSTLVPLREPNEMNRERNAKKQWGWNEEENIPPEGLVVPLNVLASVKETVKKTTSFSRFNGKENVSIAIQKQSEANTVQVSAKVKEAIMELETILPKDVIVKPVYDEAIFIKNSIAGIRNDAVTGGLIAMMVLYFFMANMRDALVVSTAIPVSIMSVFAFMYFKGISLNMLSLGGLGLAVGNFVDNAIVVVENTARHRKERDLSLQESAKTAASEVYASMFSSMLTQNAVFVPLLLVEGVAQQLFSDMFMVVIVATVASMVVSVTLIPRLCAHPLQFSLLDNYISAPKKITLNFFRGLYNWSLMLAGDSWLVSVTKDWWNNHAKKWCQLFLAGLGEERMQKGRNFYLKMLVWVFDNPKILVKYLVILSLISMVVMAFQTKVFMPRVDQGEFLIAVNMPVGTRVQVTDRVVKRIESLLLDSDVIESVTINVGSNEDEDSVEALESHQANCIVKLRRGSYKKTEDIISQIQSSFSSIDIEGARTEFVMQDSALKSAFEFQAPVMVEIKGQNLDTIKSAAEEIMTVINTIKGVTGVKNSLALPTQETQVHIDKDRAAGHQLSVSDIAKTALVAVKGYVPTEFKRDGKEIDIRVQLKEKDRANLTALNRLTLRSPRGVVISLADVARFTSGKSPSEIQHMDQQRSLVITAQVLKRSVNAVFNDLNAKIQPFMNKTEYSVTITGERKRIQESFKGLGMALVMSVLLVYMVLAAQFESLMQPLVIICTVPFSFIGISLTIWVTRTPLSAPVFLGAILLGGVVVNNGIVLIDFINQKRGEDKDCKTMDIVREACTTRLRPIIMTMLVSVLGVLPLAVGLSEGSELSSPLAVTTLGGLFVSTCLTLLVIPLVYVNLDKFLRQHKLAKENKEIEEEEVLQYE